MSGAKRNLSRISKVVGTGAALSVGVAAGLLAAAFSGGPAQAAAAPTATLQLSVPGGSSFADFSTVVATGRTTGWAFPGTYGLPGAVNLHLAYERVGATAWKKAWFPGVGGEVSAAAASSAGNVWAAYVTNTYDASISAYQAKTELYRWNGRHWSPAKSLTGTVSQISVLGNGDVWVFGSAGTLHFNGYRWITVSSSSTDGSASSDGNVWSFSGTEISHFNGHKWTTQDVSALLPPANHGVSAVNGVLALSPGNVYATAGGPPGVRGQTQGIILHFNGHAWSKVAAGGFNLNEMVSDGAGGLWIRGGSFPYNFPALFHFSGGTVSQGPVTGTTAPYGISGIPGTRSILVSGGDPAANADAQVWQVS